MALPRFLVPTLHAGDRHVVLPDEEGHHAHRVLRLGPGDPVRVFDGRGHEWDGTIAETGTRGVTVSVTQQAPSAAEPPVEVTLAVGLLKGGEMDTVVREATALGVSVIKPLRSARVVAPGRATVAAAHDRWRRVAVQSAKQCGRAVVPTVVEPLGLTDVLVDQGFVMRLMLAEPGTAADRTDGALPPRPAAGVSRPRVLLLVGPEGGWTVAEVAEARLAGVLAWRLGPRTLKAALAPTVALSALWATWGWA